MIEDLLVIVFVAGVALGVGVSALLWMVWERPRQTTSTRDHQPAEYDSEYWWNNGERP